jgi:hypothetical protein
MVTVSCGLMLTGSHLCHCLERPVVHGCDAVCITPGSWVGFHRLPTCCCATCMLWPCPCAPVLQLRFPVLHASGESCTGIDTASLLPARNRARMGTRRSLHLWCAPPELPGMEAVCSHNEPACKRCPSVHVSPPPPPPAPLPTPPRGPTTNLA